MPGKKKGPERQFVVMRSDGTLLDEIYRSIKEAEDGAEYDAEDNQADEGEVYEVFELTKVVVRGDVTIVPKIEWSVQNAAK